MKSGRYASATEVMREGLRLDEREAKFNSLPATTEASLADEAELTDADIGAELRAQVEIRKAQAGRCAN